MTSTSFRNRIRAVSRTSITVIIAVIVVVAGLAGYFALTSTTTTTSPTTSTTTTTPILTTTQHCGQDGQPLLIGMTLSQSGTFASLDGNYTHFNDAWVSFINGQGGLTDSSGNKHQVQVKWYDDQSQHDLAVSQYHKLAEQDRACILISPYSADIGKDLIPVAEADQVPIIMAEASTAGMWVPSNPHDWASTSMVPYWAVDTTTGWSGQYFKLLNEARWAKTIAFIGWDITWAKDDYNSSLNLAPKVGLTVAFHDLLTPNFNDPISDFVASEVPKLKANNPDIVYLATFGPVAALWIKNAAAQGFKPKEWHTIEWGAAFFPILTGVDFGSVTTELFWTPTFATNGGPSFAGNDLFLKLQSDSGVKFIDYQNLELRMIIFQMIQAAYQRSTSLTPAGINAALHSLSIDTVSGHLTVLPQGYGTIGLVPVQYQKGNIETVYPANLASANYIHP